MENLDPATGNQDPNVAVAEPVAQPVETHQEFTWKSNLNPDFANSPTIKNFPDTKEGFNSAVKSHLELQKMMGYEKVPIPKGPQDTVAMEAFKKAFKIPEKPEGYSLQDPTLPDIMKDHKFDKAAFQAGLHKHNVTPDQAKGLWETYTEMVKGQYAKALKDHQDHVAQVGNTMRQEWGEAYQSKVEMGQMVINKFSENQDMNDWLTTVLSKDPMGVKFLSKIGEQFSENKIGDFKYQRHSLTPDEIDRELSSIRGDMNHPYNNEKVPQADRLKAIDYVNNLIAAKQRMKTS